MPDHRHERAAGCVLAVNFCVRHRGLVVRGVLAQHRLARRAKVRLDELTGEEFVSFGPGSTVRKLLAQAAGQAGFQPRAAISAMNLGTVRALVSAGLGIAVLPQAALSLPAPPLRALRLTAPNLTRVVALARNTIRYQSPATQVFAQFLRQRLPQ